jgi:D-sedoheptulose 7-phosphate isomerase
MPQAQASVASCSSPSADYLRKLTGLLSIIDSDDVEQGVQMIRDAWDRGHQIITLGNGGSAMTALHFITDWNKAAFLAKRRSFRGRTLVDNVGLMTAYANDISYERIFSEQLANIAVEGDLVIAVSGSGNSKNVVNAIDYANEIGCDTLGLCGFSGGELKKRAKHSVWAPVDDMQLCEDVHAIFGHIVMKALVS